MKLGIVGHEAAKFTSITEREARRQIDLLCDEYSADHIISGACHLGGIDVWAIEAAESLELPYSEYPPNVLRWDGGRDVGYKQRNIQIAEDSDVVCCIVVKKYPTGYKGMRFNKCYHCNTTSHIKSGGCWTVKYAKNLGKETRVIEI